MMIMARMLNLRTILFSGVFLAIFFFESLGWAQVDSTSVLLVRPSNSTGKSSELDSSSGLASDRYTVKQYTVKQSTQSKKQPTQIIQSTQTSNPTPTEEHKIISPPPLSAEDTKKNTNNKDAIVNKNESITPAYPESSRQNILEVSIAPGFLYVDSSSQYWFREYSSSGPGLAFRADVWGSSSVGLYAGYFTTLTAGLTSSPTSERVVLADHRFTDIGLHFRKYSNLSAMSASMIFGIGYAEYQMIVPGGEQNRTRVKSSGPNISLQAKFPQNFVRKNIFGIELMPKQNVEEQKTSANVKSGTRPMSYTIKFSVGQEYSIDLNHQVFWRMSYRHEQTVYRGTANVDDPIDGTKPEGVAVRSGMSLFEVGYTWGE